MAQELFDGPEPFFKHSMAQELLVVTLLDGGGVGGGVGGLVEVV